MTNVWACLPEPGKGQNIGTLIRTCDAFGCGIILADHPDIEDKVRHGLRIPKEHMPPVQYMPTDIDLQIEWFARRKTAGVEIVGLECTADAVAVKHYIGGGSSDVIVVAGHERKGIREEIIALCDFVLCLPQQGHDVSMNIVTATSIALAKICGHV